MMWKWLTGIIASMGVIIALLLSSRKTQKERADRVENEARQKDEVIENVQKASEVHRAVSNDPDPVKRLRDEWSRD